VPDPQASGGADGRLFDSGGDALLAVQLISAIADELGIQVAPRRLFDANTVELMATVIRNTSIS
jgi:acyl carrier protein